MRIVVAMSGGVDSSVAAALLKQEGHDVVGMTLQLWGKDVCVSSGTKLCCSVRDAMDAKSVAKRLGIPHHTLELVQEFRAHVVDYFVNSYAEGLTPNPCIACNDHIKFGSLLGKALELGAEAVATGHYARLAHDPGTGRYQLRRAVDATKDQSYVLFGLTQQQLRHTRLPLGAMSKPAVREIARELGFVTADKPDSQDICFVRDRNKNGFLRNALGDVETSGPIVDVQGRVLGRHRGLLGYTIGQREGLGLAMGMPMYVVAIDRERNRLIVGTRDALLEPECLVTKLNWVSIAPPETPIRASVKIRSQHAAAPATLLPQADGSMQVAFDHPQSAVTPGQAAVFYGAPRVKPRGDIAPKQDGRFSPKFPAEADDGDLVLGGGMITATAATLALEPAAAGHGH